MVAGEQGGQGLQGEFALGDGDVVGQDQDLVDRGRELTGVGGHRRVDQLLERRAEFIDHGSVPFLTQPT